MAASKKAPPGEEASAAPPKVSTDPLWATTNSFVTNWAIVRKTKAFTDDSATGEAVIKKLNYRQLAGHGITIPSGVEIEKELSGDELAFYRNVDNELKIHGLRFHHAFFALEASPVTAAVQAFRDANVPRTKFSDKMSYHDHAADHAAAQAKFDAAMRSLAEAIDKAPPAAFGGAAKPTANDALAGKAGAVDDRSFKASLALAVAQKHTLDLVLTNTGRTFGHGGHTKKLGSVADVDAYIRGSLTNRVALLRAAVIKAGHTPDLADEYVSMAITTFARYFTREGNPNAINTYDGTFTYGVGFNTFASLGVQLLTDMANPARLEQAFNQEALRVAREFLLNCGIAIFPKLSASVANVRVLHFEGDVPYVLMNSVFTTPQAPTRPRAPSAKDIIGKVIGTIEASTYDYSVKSWAAEVTKLEKMAADASTHQALQYLRFNEQLVNAFIMLGSEPTPPGLTRKTKDYQIVLALVEASFINFVEQSGPDLFPLWYLVRAGGKPGAKPPSGTAAFSFLHHLAWWGFGGFPNVGRAMRWSLSRKYVKTSVFTSKSDVAAADSHIEMKSGAIVLRPGQKKPSLAVQADDDTDETGVDDLSRVVIDDSTATMVGVVKGAFAYIELTHNLTQWSDIGFWNTLCKLWTSFLDDLKAERDIKLVPAVTVPLPGPDEVVYDGRGKFAKPAILYLGTYYVPSKKYPGTYVELPSGVPVDQNGQLINNRVAKKDAKGNVLGWSVETESMEARLARSIGDVAPTFPFAKVADARRDIEDELVDECPIAFGYKSYDGATPNGMSRGKKKPTDLCAQSYANLQRYVDDVMVSRYVIAHLSKRACDAAKQGGTQNSDGRDYLSDVDEGDYIVANKRDAAEIDVGFAKRWDELYDLHKIEVDKT